MYYGLRLAYASSGVGNLLGKPKNRKGFTVKDFMPDLTIKKRAGLSGNELFTKMLTINRLMGGRFIDARNN